MYYIYKNCVKHEKTDGVRMSQGMPWPEKDNIDIIYFIYKIYNKHKIYYMPKMY